MDGKLIERITDAVMDLMVRRANVSTTGPKFTKADIAAAVVADPTGETACYLAQLIAWGIEWLGNFRRHPDLMDLFGAQA